ncbi:DNA-binding transcriptional LysR family regulator [Bacillus ectoiniformans]|nr:DNA-binding transcriptional LysR family regulator [Bacillus ectoiniformans]
MSQHLAALESEIGELLFIRAPRKMIPTDKGKELYTKIVPLIENLERITLETRYASYTKSVPLIKIGSPAEYFTKSALFKLSDLNTRFSVQFNLAHNLLKALEKDEVDMIITTQKTQVDGIEYTKIEDESFVVTAPAGYSGNHINTNDREDWLNQQTWLSFGLELPIIRRYWRVHFKKRPELKPNYIFPDLRTILEGIEQNMGISILPTYLIEDSIKQEKSVILFPELSVENTIYAAFKVENKDDLLIKNVIQELKKS